MSADGEIQIAVRSEGVEDAAGEFGGDTAGGGGPGGTGGGGATAEGIQSTASSTKRMAGLLGAIAALLTVIEPIMRVLGVVSNVLQAFVAPLAMVLMRLLQPALRWLLQLLPGWLNWIEENEGKIDAVIAQIYTLGALLVPILELVWGGIQTLVSLFTPSGEAEDGVTRQFGSRVVGPTPNVPGAGRATDTRESSGILEGLLQDFLDSSPGFGEDSQNAQSSPIQIVFAGGTGTLLETVETNPNLEQ